MPFRLGTILRTLGHAVSGGGGTPPGSPTISLNSVTHNTATFNHTPPSDADYASTPIYVHRQDGTLVHTGTGSGATITVSGLSPANSYIAVAIAVSTVPLTSVPSVAGCVVAFATYNTATPDNPLYFKWGFNDTTEQHEASPVTLDASVLGMRTIHHLGRGRIFWFMTECDAPVDALEIRNFGFRTYVRDDRIGGIHDANGM